jgi:hypothetical protein
MFWWASTVAEHQPNDTESFSHASTKYYQPCSAPINSPPFIPLINSPPIHSPPFIHLSAIFHFSTDHSFQSSLKPGSGGLECDIGSMGDVIGRRRGSLGPGMVEASMMIKLNKDRIVRDPMLVKEYRTSWQAFIPKRPDDPADYYMNNESEDEDDGNGNIRDEREEDNPFDSSHSEDDNIFT